MCSQSYLRELIRIMVPKFHAHLEKYSDSKELLFCHRWILLWVLIEHLIWIAFQSALFLRNWSFVIDISSWGVSRKLFFWAFDHHVCHISYSCFKREFTEAVAIRMWEACWSNYLTDYFHLFLCLAIIAVYADDVVAQDLRTDEMLLHFSSLGTLLDSIWDWICTFTEFSL